MALGIAQISILALLLTGRSLPSLGLGLILPLSTSQVVVITIKWHHGGGGGALKDTLSFWGDPASQGQDPCSQSLRADEAQPSSSLTRPLVL